LQAKQSSVAPVAGALLLRFLGAAAAAAALLLVAVESGFWTSAGCWAAVVDETAMVGVIKEEVLLQSSTTLHLQQVERV
jgi:hypothetical protein